MSLFDSDETFIGEDTFGKISDAPLNEFKPWHKPRKQLIRDKQWLEQFLRLLRGKAYRNIDVVNYFGLPGGDLLDVNYIFDSVIKRTSKAEGKKFGFHGFINNDIDHKKAQAELTKLLDKEYIDQRSKIDQFRFEDLKLKSSTAWARVENFGIYHFINLDFCNNVLSPETLVSILYLLKHQINRIADMPWLLCITTRLNKESAKEDIIVRFNKILHEYLGTSLLKVKIKECFSLVDSYIAEKADITTVESKEVMNQLLQICLVMWILKESIDNNCSVKLKSSFKYSVNLYNREADMHSYVFSFEKKTKKDDLLGILPESKQENVDLDFEHNAIQAIETLSQSWDIDSYLDDNKDVLNHYAMEMIELLKKCSYDTESYKEVMTSKFGYIF